MPVILTSLPIYPVTGEIDRISAGSTKTAEHWKWCTLHGKAFEDVR